MASASGGETLGILLISGGHERAHYAFMLATAAASMGRRVMLFATNDGIQALRLDWRPTDPGRRDDQVRARGLAGLDELREAARDLGIRLTACDAAIHLANLAEADLLPNVEIIGIPTFLEATTRSITL